jgi:hypothetical protein
VKVDEYKDMTLQVKNGGGGVLSGEVKIAEGAGFTIVSGATFSLKAGEQQKAVVRFTPTDEKGYTGTVRVAAGTLVKEVQISGSGYKASTGCFGGSIGAAPSGPGAATGELLLAGMLVAGLFVATRLSRPVKS